MSSYYAYPVKQTAAVNTAVNTKFAFFGYNAKNVFSGSLSDQVIECSFFMPAGFPFVGTDAAVYIKPYDATMPEEYLARKPVDSAYCVEKYATDGFNIYKMAFTAADFLPRFQLPGGATSGPLQFAFIKHGAVYDLSRKPFFITAAVDMLSADYTSRPEQYSAAFMLDKACATLAEHLKLEQVHRRVDKLAMLGVARAYAHRAEQLLHAENGIRKYLHTLPVAYGDHSKPQQMAQLDEKMRLLGLLPAAAVKCEWLIKRAEQAEARFYAKFIATLKSKLEKAMAICAADTNVTGAAKLVESAVYSVLAEFVDARGYYEQTEHLVRQRVVDLDARWTWSQSVGAAWTPRVLSRFGLPVEQKAAAVLQFYAGGEYAACWNKANVKDYVYRIGDHEYTMGAVSSVPVYTGNMQRDAERYAHDKSRFAGPSFAQLLAQLTTLADLVDLYAASTSSSTAPFTEYDASAPIMQHIRAHQRWFNGRLNGLATGEVGAERFTQSTGLFKLRELESQLGLFADHLAKAKQQSIHRQMIELCGACKQLIGSTCVEFTLIHYVGPLAKLAMSEAAWAKVAALERAHMLAKFTAIIGEQYALMDAKLAATGTPSDYAVFRRQFDLAQIGEKMPRGRVQYPAMFERLVNYDCGDAPAIEDLFDFHQAMYEQLVAMHDAIRAQIKLNREATTDGDKVSLIGGLFDHFYRSKAYAYFTLVGHKYGNKSWIFQPADLYAIYKQMGAEKKEDVYNTWNTSQQFYGMDERVSGVFADYAAGKYAQAELGGEDSEIIGDFYKCTPISGGGISDGPTFKYEAEMGEYGSVAAAAMAALRQLEAEDEEEEKEKYAVSRGKSYGVDKSKYIAGRGAEIFFEKPALYNDYPVGGKPGFYGF